MKMGGEFNVMEMRIEYVVDIKQVAHDPEAQMVILPFAQRDTGRHRHRCFELAYVTGGSATHLLNNEEIPVSKGDYFILDYDSVHGYTDCRDFSLINCLFLPEMIDSTLAGCRTLDEFMRVCLIRYYKQYFGYTAVNRIFRDEDGQILMLLQESHLPHFRLWNIYRKKEWRRHVAFFWAAI